MVKQIASKHQNIDSRSSAALYVYVISYVLYLYFFRIENDIDIALIFKPIIIPSVAFAYFFTTKTDNIYPNLLLFIAIFFADNLILIDERDIKVLSTYLYIIAIGILFTNVVVDSKVFISIKNLKNKLNFFVVCYLSIFILYKILTMILNVQFNEIYIVLAYVFLFLMVLILTIYNVIRFKSIASRFLLLTILCLFFSDIFIVLNRYYLKNDIFIYISSIIELPVYYFLLKYLLFREKY